MKDLFGLAMLDFQTNNSPENILTETSISDQDEMLVDYLFRSYSQMPMIEQKVLKLCFGKILDVGCGAGSHSLYLQNEKNLEVFAIDISENAIKTCKLRGLKNAFVKNILDLENQKFETILLLMNGTGIFGTIDNTALYLEKLKSLLNTNGQILIDSSDLKYMYDEDDFDYLKNNSKKYYGEIEFNITYKNQKEEPFNWLYLDFEMLKSISSKIGFDCKLIIEGNNFDYLAQLTF